MSESWMPSTALLVVIPLTAALFARPSLSRDAARALGVGAASMVMLLSVGVSWSWYAERGSGLSAAPLFAVDQLNVLLLPFAASMFLFVLLVQPRTDAIERSLRRALLAEALTMAVFLSSEPVILAVLWCLSAALGVRELHLLGEDGRGARRVFVAYALPSCVLVVVGALLLHFDFAVSVASLMIAAAVMIRKGILPLHSWLPEMFARAPLPVAVLFNAPQIGALVAVRLLAPQAPAWVLEMISLASLLTAVYGAGLALVQDEPRRVLGWLFLSQSALVLVGLESQASMARAGGLAMWISSGLSVAGFGMAIAALEARRGPLSLRQFAGGYDRKPLLAVCFLVLGLASVGFPGTLGFAAQEALVHGVVNEFPYLGFAILVASMLNGIVVVRTYFVLFCGRREPNRPPQALRPREQVGFICLTAILIVAGLLPGPFVRAESGRREPDPAAANRQETLPNTCKLGCWRRSRGDTSVGTRRIAEEHPRRSGRQATQ